MANLRSRLYMLLIAAMFAGAAFLVGFAPMPEDVIVGGKSNLDDPPGIVAEQPTVQLTNLICFRPRERP